MLLRIWKRSTSFWFDLSKRFGEASIEQSGGGSNREGKAWIDSKEGQKLKREVQEKQMIIIF